MDQCTHEVRLQYWKNVISQCQARPAGQSAKQWMKENGICEQTYYLWQRRIRQEAYDRISSNELLPAVSKKNDITFAEFHVPSSESDSSTESLPEQLRHPTAIIKIGNCSIALTNDISDRLLIRILQEVSHA